MVVGANSWGRPSHGGGGHGGGLLIQQVSV